MHVAILNRSHLQECHVKARPKCINHRMGKTENDCSVLVVKLPSLDTDNKRPIPIPMFDWLARPE